MDAVAELYKKIEDGRKGCNVGIPSGFPKLDKYIYGIQRKFLTTIIADSGSGKSSLALFMYVYMPLKYALSHPETPVDILYLSFEMEKSVLLAKLLSLYIADRYQKDLSYAEILSLGDIISEENLSIVYEAKEWLYRVDEKLTIYDKPLNALGVFNIIRTWTEYFGHYEETEKDGEVYIKNNTSQYLICVMDHCKLLINSGSGTKYEIDQCAKYFVILRNQCGLTLCAVQQANRQFKSMDRRNSEHSYLELQDAQDTADMTQASEIVIGIYHPFREKRAKCEGFNISKLGDSFRLIQLLKGRFGQSDIVEGCVFHGKMGYFKELDPPQEGKKYDYDRVLSLNYLVENRNDKEKDLDNLDSNTLNNPEIADKLVKEKMGNDIEDDEEDNSIGFNFNLY